MRSRHALSFSCFTYQWVVTSFIFSRCTHPPPVLEVKNLFRINGGEFSLYLDREKLAKEGDCVTALVALVAAFHVFGIQHPRRLSQTFNFLETLIFDVQSPCFPVFERK